MVVADGIRDFYIEVYSIKIVERCFPLVPNASWW